MGAEDVGRVATALLVNKDLLGQNAFDLIVELPTVKEISDTAAAVLGRPIRYVEITDEQWSQAAAQQINAHAVDHLSHLWRFFRELHIRKGEDGFRSTAGEIRALTGIEPQALEQFFQHAGLR